MARAELEAAIAAIITNRRVCTAFTDDPGGFAASLPLEPAEADSLVAMQADLASLMPSFVAKRMRLLRGSSRRTLGLLGERGRRLLVAHADSHPPNEELRGERQGLADFLVEQSRRLRPTIESGPVIADMARYERALIMSECASRPIVARPPTTLLDPHPVTADLTGLRFAPGTTLCDFEFDLRSLDQFEPATAASQVPDKCDLLFHHAMYDSRVLVRRLQPFEVAAVARIRETPGRSVEQLCEGLDHRTRAVHTLTQLAAQGAFEWV